MNADEKKQAVETLSFVGLLDARSEKTLEQEIKELDESLNRKSEEKDERLRSVLLEREILKITSRIGFI